MKRRLTLEIFLSILGVVWLSVILWLIGNIISIQARIKFSDNFYGVAFRPGEVLEEYIDSIEIFDNKLSLNEEKINELEVNEAWIQVLDNRNEEIYSYNKPLDVPVYYTIGEYEKFAENYWEIGNSTIFSEGFEIEESKYSIILGFKFNKVLRKTFVYTKENIIFNLSLLGFGIIVSIIVAYLFSRRLARPMNKVIEKIRLLSQEKYIDNENSVDEVYKSLNDNIYMLSERLKFLEKERLLIEKNRNEWISNVTHDLKTPLASIQGYSEILNSEKYDVKHEERVEYSKIILSKVKYIAELIEDLKLTYQLRTKEIPLKIEAVNIVELVREIIIDILNNPLYENREIDFRFNSEKVIVNIDSHYMKRAINNLIYNAIIHNSDDIDINISVNVNNINNVFIEIKDNGNGIAEEDLENIFKRHYRGSNTGEKHKGSGLGMAISKEIVEANNGKIEIESTIGNGTKIIIKL